MADIIPFRKPNHSEKSKGRTLCDHGFHKWLVIKDNEFDTKKGRLVTRYRCSRCKLEKSKAL